MLIIDTDILIDVSHAVPHAVHYLEAIEPEISLCISVMTQLELIIGCRNKRELRALELFLAEFTVIPVTETISAEAVSLLKKYRLSHGLLIADAIIAATAIVEGSPLVSKNQRDYRFIENLNLLSY